MNDREHAKKARPPSDDEPWVVADDTGLRVTFRNEDAAWRYRDEYTNRLVNPTVTYEPAALVPLDPACSVHGNGRITPPAMVTPGAVGCTCGAETPND